MNDNISNYINEIEKYFLNLIGRGVMLSSKDYYILSNYFQNNVSKEIIIKGINNAFNSNLKLKSISDCKNFIDELTSVFDKQNYYSESEKIDNKPFVLSFIDRFNQVVSEESNENLKNFYISFNEKVTELLEYENDKVFAKLDLLEKEFYDKFFDTLDDSEASNLINEAENMISNDSKFINDEVRKNTLIAFRNKILVERFGLINLFDIS